MWFTSQATCTGDHQSLDAAIHAVLEWVSEMQPILMSRFADQPPDTTVLYVSSVSKMQLPAYLPVCV